MTKTREELNTELAPNDRGRITSAVIRDVLEATALSVEAVPIEALGVTVATLDETGLVPVTQLPPAVSGYSGYSGIGISGYSGYGISGFSGFSGFSGVATSGFSGYSGSNGASGISGYSGTALAKDIEISAYELPYQANEDQ